MKTKQVFFPSLLSASRWVFGVTVFMIYFGKALVYYYEVEIIRS
jgi:hypothetical protein